MFTFIRVIYEPHININFIKCVTFIICVFYAEIGAYPKIIRSENVHNTSLKITILINAIASNLQKILIRRNV